MNRLEATIGMEAGHITAAEIISRGGARNRAEILAAVQMGLLDRIEWQNAPAGNTAKYLYALNPLNRLELVEWPAWTQPSKYVPVRIELADEWRS